MRVMENGLGPPVLLDELLGELAGYENRYEMTTVEFVARFDDPSDPLEGIDDSDLWYSAAEAVRSLRWGSL